MVVAEVLLLDVVGGRWAAVETRVRDMRRRCVCPVGSLRSVEALPLVDGSEGKVMDEDCVRGGRLYARGTGIES